MCAGERLRESIKYVLATDQKQAAWFWHGLGASNTASLTRLMIDFCFARWGLEGAVRDSDPGGRMYSGVVCHHLRSAWVVGGVVGGRFLGWTENRTLNFSYAWSVTCGLVGSRRGSGCGVVRADLGSPGLTIRRDSFISEWLRLYVSRTHEYRV